MSCISTTWPSPVLHKTRHWSRHGCASAVRGSSKSQTAAQSDAHVLGDGAAGVLVVVAGTAGVLVTVVVAAAVVIVDVVVEGA